MEARAGGRGGLIPLIGIDRVAPLPRPMAPACGRLRHGGAPALADRLRIRFGWLPWQAPRLTPMNHLWRKLKRLVTANRQAKSIDAVAAEAAAWVLILTPQQARRKAGMMSQHFWLKKLLLHF